MRLEQQKANRAFIPSPGDGMPSHLRGLQYEPCKSRQNTRDCQQGGGTDQPSPRGVFRWLAGGRRQTIEDEDEQQGADCLNGDGEMNGTDGGER
jgi:hypothetical protein